MASLQETQATFSQWLLTNRSFAWIVTVLVLFIMSTGVPVSIID